MIHNQYPVIALPKEYDDSIDGLESGIKILIDQGMITGIISSRHIDHESLSSHISDSCVLSHREDAIIISAEGGDGKENIVLMGYAMTEMTTDSLGTHIHEALRRESDSPFYTHTYLSQGDHQWVLSIEYSWGDVVWQAQCCYLWKESPEIMWTVLHTWPAHNGELEQGSRDHLSAVYEALVNHYADQ